MKRLPITSILMVITAVSCVGCTKQNAKQQSTTPHAPHIVSVPAFAKTAVDAVGGEQAWANTQVILGGCTAKFYRPDGSFYLTRQRHAVYPWSDSIRIYASEPQGTFVWQLTGTDFTLLEGTPQQAENLPMTLCNPFIARVIWSIMASPASIATNTDPNTATLGKAVRIEGIWHHPLKIVGGQAWYQNVDSGILDLYRIEYSDKHIFLTARGYGYRSVEKTDIMLPTKIEIFSSDTAASESRRIIELDYQILESVGF
jgi:hypothetical protein